ncbi:hypothetical protein DPEC_G00302760 [Dallia pectoralis]|uniref:Uncharacterized protein n=1 Tax=Dallia pectoralis TaxID=75939 RepID=A0ACC2FH18_DALPE|nr:hypothetical protein DPEC_G00302760 [Dallia pectoralis]
MPSPLQISSATDTDGGGRTPPVLQDLSLFLIGYNGCQTLTWSLYGSLFLGLMQPLCPGSTLTFRNWGSGHPNTAGKGRIIATDGFGLKMLVPQLSALT